LLAIEQGSLSAPRSFSISRDGCARLFGPQLAKHLTQLTAKTTIQLD